MLLSILLLLAPALRPQADGKPVPAPPVTGREFPDLGLTVTFPSAFSAIAEERDKSEQLRQRWTARLGSVDLDIQLWVLSNEKFGFEEPEDVMDVLLYNLREGSRGDAYFSFDARELVAGNYGIVPYASLARAALRPEGSTQETGLRLYLGGLLEQSGYSIEVLATPPPGPDGLQTLVGFLRTGVSFKGRKRAADWTEQEVGERWARIAPARLLKDLGKVVRTAHYVVFTNSNNSGTAEKFGEQMERNYQAILEVFPFEDVAGRRLMPVFLFTSADDYFEFFAKQFDESLEEARKSKGVAHADWYATYFEAKTDPVHIHEGTHQIFRNRLRLPGGGSWFQEGVAEYMATTRNDLNVAARTVKKGRHTALKDFVKIRSLLFSAADDVKGGDEAAGHYQLAALLIEFLHDSRFGKDKFQEFVHAVGLAAPNSVPAIERALRTAYATDLAGLEKQWVEYCKKR